MPRLLRDLRVGPFRRKPDKADESSDCSPGWTAGVHLDPFVEAQHPNEQVARAQEKLRDSTKKLEETLRKYAVKSQGFPTIDDESMKKAMAAARDSPSKSGEVFGKFIEKVLKDKKNQEETVTGKISNCLAKVYPVAVLALGLVSFGADAAGFQPLKITANGLGQVLSLATKERSQSDTIVKQLEKLSDHQQFLNKWRDLNPDSLEDSILEKATKLLAAITDFLRASVIYLQNHTIENAVKGIFAADASPDKSLLEARLEFDQAVLQETSLIIMRWQQEEKTQKALFWLSNLDFAKKQGDLRQRRVDGTGKWLLEDPDYQRWLNGDISTLWCPGLPGAGKTFITSMVVDDFQHRIEMDKLDLSAAGVGIAYVYCDINSQSDQTTLALIASIARQLVEQKPPLLRLVKASREKQNDKPPTLEGCTELLSSIARELDRVVVIVDALDELDDIKSLNRVSFVNSLLNLPLQVFVTSRDLETIGALLKRAIRLDIRSQYEDIQLYVDWRIRNSPRLKSNIKDRKDYEDKIIDTVITKSLHRLNLARLQMDYIQDQPTIGHVLEALTKLPITENEFYGQSIDRIKKDSSDPNWAMRILAWIFGAQRPLEIRELRHAMAVRPGKLSAAEHEQFLPEEQSLVDDCAGLVVANRQSGTITLAHPTIREYLNIVRLDKFSIDPEIEITRTCLTYLLYDIFAIGPCNDNGKLPTHLENYPLLGYAAQYWGYHARGDPELELQVLILTFLEQQSNLSFSVQAGEAARLEYMGYETYVQFPTKTVRGLTVVASFGLAKIVGLLLQEEGEDIEAERDKRMGALHQAAENGHEAVVQLLLEHKADVNVNDGRKLTALQQAARNGHEAVVQLLLEHGVYANAKDYRGSTALYLAAVNRHQVVVRLLLEHNADANVVNEYGRTALRTAADNGNDTVVQLLLDHGADANAKDYDGWTALHLAAKNGHGAVVRLLLDHRADANAKDYRGSTALYLAAVNRHQVVVRLLLEHNADANVVNEYGRTALRTAAGNGNDTVVQLLLDHGADANAKDYDGWTALHWAARRGHEAVVQQLLKHNVDINIEDNDGKTALHRAAEKGHQEIVSLLQLFPHPPPS